MTTPTKTVEQHVTVTYLRGRHKHQSNRHIAIIDGVRYFRSYAKPRPKVDRSEYMKQYRLKKKQQKQEQQPERPKEVDIKPEQKVEQVVETVTQTVS